MEIKFIAKNSMCVSFDVGAGGEIRTRLFQFGRLTCNRKHFTRKFWRSQGVTIPLLWRDKPVCVHEHLETKLELLFSVLKIVVPPPGIEPGSKDFQSSAMTTFAKAATCSASPGGNYSVSNLWSPLTHPPPAPRQGPLSHCQRPFG